jgi:hypothetical protein
MTRRPQSDLDALTVPKAGSTTPPAASTPPARETRSYAHTLSLRLTAEQYRRLRRYVAGEEERTGSRMTHQAIIETALSEWLERQGG